MARLNSAGSGAGPPATVANYVTEAIRSGILDGRYPLGSRLDQQLLAEELGASIIPVRETLRQLEAEGLVQIAPRRGAFVVKLSDDEVREVYRLRAVLEAFATREAVPAVTDGDLDEMDDLLTDLDRIGQKGADEKWARINRSWHFKLYSAAESPLLLQFISALWDRCRMSSHTYVRDAGHCTKSQEDHLKIMAAVRARDADLAADLIAQHVADAMNDLLGGDSA